MYMYKDDFRKSADLFRGLSVLKEEIIDKKTGDVCRVGKAWNKYLDEFENHRVPEEIWEEINDRYELEDYQYNVLLKLSQALEIVMESGLIEKI